jgi:hypothetical protein
VEGLGKHCSLSSQIVGGEANVLLELSPFERNDGGFSSHTRTLIQKVKHHASLVWSADLVYAEPLSVAGTLYFYVSQAVVDGPFGDP